MKKVKYKSALKNCFCFPTLKKWRASQLCVLLAFFFFFCRTPVIGSWIPVIVFNRENRRTGYYFLFTVSLGEISESLSSFFCAEILYVRKLLHRSHIYQIKQVGIFGPSLGMFSKQILRIFTETIWAMDINSKICDMNSENHEISHIKN